MKNEYPKTLLYTELNGNASDNITESLEYYGYRVYTASSPEEAALITAQNEIDVLLIGLGPELLNGEPDIVQTVLEIRELPVMYLAGDELPPDVDRITETDTCGFISRNAGAAVMNLSIKSACRTFSRHKSAAVESIYKEFEKARAMLNDVMNTIPVRVFWKDLDSVYMGCNRLFARDAGRESSEEIIGLTDYDIRDKAQAELNRADDRLIMKSGKARLNYEERLITTSGEENWILTSKIPLRNSEGRMYGVLGAYYNITERKKLQEQLLQERNRLSDIIFGSNVGTWEWNIRTGENRVNDNWAAMLGYGYDELELDKPDFWRDMMHPDDLEPNRLTLDDHFKGRTEFYESEFRLRHKDGHWVWVLSRGRVSLRADDGKPLEISGTHLDITERRLAQEEILYQLRENEIILKEAHHRIKNNLASIDSLLSLQADSGVSQETQTALHEAAGRVRSMEVLYEKLLLENDLRSSSLKSYLEELIDDIVKVCTSPARIRLEKRIEDISINHRKMFPLGIIINELITNTIKYAFVGRSAGTIAVEVSRRGPDVVVRIEDDGGGAPRGLCGAEKAGVRADAYRCAEQAARG